MIFSIWANPCGRGEWLGIFLQYAFFILSLKEMDFTFRWSHLFIFKDYMFSKIWRFSLMLRVIMDWSWTIMIILALWHSKWKYDALQISSLLRNFRDGYLIAEPQKLASSCLNHDLGTIGYSKALPLGFKPIRAEPSWAEPNRTKSKIVRDILQFGRKLLKTSFSWIRLQ